MAHTQYCNFFFFAEYNIVKLVTLSACLGIHH